MTDKNMADVAEKIADQIGGAFQRVAPGLWESMARYEFAAAWASIGASVLIMAVAASVLVFANRRFGTSEDTDERETFGLICIACTVVLAISAFVTALNMPSNIGAIVAPEAAAARSVLEKISE